MQKKKDISLDLNQLKHSPLSLKLTEIHKKYFKKILLDLDICTMKNLGLNESQCLENILILLIFSEISPGVNLEKEDASPSSFISLRQK